MKLVTELNLQSGPTGLPVELSRFVALLVSDQRDRSHHAISRGRRVLPNYVGKHILAEISLAAEKKDFFWHGTAVWPRQARLLGEHKSSCWRSRHSGNYAIRCFVPCLLNGAKRQSLREKLSELETPTLPAFAVLIDTYMHSKATAGSSAAAAAISRQGGNRNKNNKNKNNSGNRPGLSDTEKKRRSVMKGKCYRCGSPDHMANNCSVAKDVKCKKCSTVGHTQAACVASGQARATDDRPLRIPRTIRLWL